LHWLSIDLFELFMCGNKLRVFMMGFPKKRWETDAGQKHPGFLRIRMRRLRKGTAMRRLVRETSLSVDDLVYPLFVRQGQGTKEAIASMTDCFRFSPDTIAAEAGEVSALGIGAVLLFGVASEKDDSGSEAWSKDGAVQQAVREIKKAVPELLVITDVCLCAYTKSGHCGVVENSKIDNDKTCRLLAKVALSHAQAGADVVAPSDMMDGRVGYIRQALDENGFEDTAIMSYSAKYASTFYGPFRDAADSAPAFGDRKGYQMDPANSDQAMAEIALDIEEEADIVMIKPALCFLDVIYRAKQRFSCPIAAYNVSGEYMMLKAAAEKGLIDKEAAILEMLCSIKRAGADIIITYFAKEAAGLLNRKNR
jgi:porphobilinogen synthase